MLDPLGREEIIRLVHEIKNQYGVTVLSITHDIDEASLADRILVMKAGQLQAQDVPAKIFEAGKDLIEMGLDLPFSEKVRLQMKDLGVDVPDHYLDEEGLIEWLSQSYLNK